MSNIRGIFGDVNPEVGSSKVATSAFVTTFDSNDQRLVAFLGDSTVKGSRELALVLGVRAYDFVSKDTNKKVSGVTLITTDGLVVDEPLYKGVKIVDYGFLSENSVAILKSFKEVPAWYVLELRFLDSKKVKLVNVYSVAGIIEGGA